MPDPSHLRHLSSSTMLQADSQSTSSKGQKRCAALPELSSAQKCARTELSDPSDLMYGAVTSPQRPMRQATFSDKYTQEAAEEAAAAAAKAEFSPGMGHESQDAEPSKQGLRPTPVPITPQGSQPDAQQRNKVCGALQLVQGVPGGMHAVATPNMASTMHCLFYAVGHVTKAY